MTEREYKWTESSVSFIITPDWKPVPAPKRRKGLRYWRDRLAWSLGDALISLGERLRGY